MAESMSWSGPRPFVGRDRTRRLLSLEVKAVMRGSGRAAFLLGPEGSGRTTCLGLFQEEAFRDHRGVKAEYVDCASSGTKTWAELSEIFTREHRLKRSAKFIAIDWLESIPIVGKIGQAVVRTAVAVRTGHVDPGKLRRVRPGAIHETALAAVRMLLENEPREPRVIIMDSLDRGDSEDLAGAAALIPQLPKTRTLFVAAVGTVDGRPPKAIADLILEAERLGLATRIELPPLPNEVIGETIRQATGGIAPLAWVEWLADRSGGNPTALWNAMGQLEAAGHLKRAGGRWRWKGSPPDEVTTSQAAGPSRDWALDERDRKLMALAACEGREFHSAVLARLAGLDELSLEDRLSGLCRVGLVEYRDTAALGDDVTSRYAFRHEADVRFFSSLIPEQELAELADHARDIRQELGL